MTLHLLCRPGGSFEQFNRTLERLAEKLAPKGWKRFNPSIFWPFPKRENKEFFSTVERYKTLFIFA